AVGMNAYLVQDALLASGVKTYLMETVTRYGQTAAQVSVERADLDRAKAVVDDFKRRQAQRRGGGGGGGPGGAAIEVVCEGCGGHVSFAAGQQGSVQKCPQCGAYLDVGDKNLAEGLQQGEGEAGVP